MKHAENIVSPNLWKVVVNHKKRMHKRMSVMKQQC